MHITCNGYINCLCHAGYILSLVMFLILLIFSYKICEKSVSTSDASPSSPAALEFVRGKLLASGCMIRPSEGGSTIYLVEHLDLEVLFISSCNLLRNYTLVTIFGEGYILMVEIPCRLHLFQR